MTESDYLSGAVMDAIHIIGITNWTFGHKLKDAVVSSR